MSKSQKPLNQLDGDIRDWIGKTAFSIVNGNHILKYTEADYHGYLEKHPETIIRLWIFLFVSHNKGYDDQMMFDDYDEQWLAQQADPAFKSELDFENPEFDYENLLPYQKVVVDFTKEIIRSPDFSGILYRSSALECIYHVLMNNMDVNPGTEEILNKEKAINRGLEMYRSMQEEIFVPVIPFEAWETDVYLA